MNKIALITAIIENSIAFSCNHVAYEIKNEYVIVRGTNDNVNFHATDLVGIIDSIASCFLTIEEGRIILKCY